MHAALTWLIWVVVFGAIFCVMAIIVVTGAALYLAKRAKSETDNMYENLTHSLKRKR